MVALYRMQLKAILILFLVSACGGATREPEPREPMPRVSANVPTSGTPSLFQVRSKELAARLAACRDDLVAHQPRPLSTLRSSDFSAQCKQALRELVAGCGIVDLQELAAHDRITQPCKEALWKLFLEEDSHRSRVTVLGSARAKQTLDLFVTASDDQGEPSRDDVRVYLEIAGQLELVERATTAPLPARCDTPIFTASSILDYSGSMSDRDVDESIEVMRTLYAALPAGCLETDVLLFSDIVRHAHGPTTDLATMQRAVARDDRFPRSTTALIDALGDGLRGVADRHAPVRLLVVATDGKENASKRWSYADFVHRAQQAGVRVISFGSLLSDVEFLDLVGRDTGGFFIYRPRARVLAHAAQTVGRLLAATRRIHVADARLGAATHVVIERGDHRVRLPL
ncbi:MAG TPA: vWA domain-containing protein [Kofleriaceae bacterium]